MRKRIGSFILAAVMLLGLLAGNTGLALTASAEGGVVLKLHYNRPDGNYDGWDIWFWSDTDGGSAIAFAEENGEMVGTYNVDPGIIKIGYIVRYGGSAWTAKDVSTDQFIEIPEVVSGTVHVYVNSGVMGHTITYGEDAKTGVNIRSAEYDGSTSITVTMTGAVTGDLNTAFTLTQDGSAIALTSVTDQGGNVYTLGLSEPLNEFLTYQLAYEESILKVTIPNPYSTEDFEARYTYKGDDLGATWTSEKTTFRVWAPTATGVMVNLYSGGEKGRDDLIGQVPMTADSNGTWVGEKSGDLSGTYYTYEVDIGGTVTEACDPYAWAVGVNGDRAMVIDLDSTDPEGWENDSDPNAGLSITDAIIYELHIRDLSSDSSSGIQNVGKYLGLTETGTVNASGISTGLDHIRDLGITHIHLLPVYDYATVDETKLDTPQFNWGYDPKNYNVPEGSYSTDPYNGEVRVKEFKTMVKTLHDNGISVIMDVVYNHVYNAGEFCFNQIVPAYFSRVDSSGVYSNGSGCGNDTASERSMVRKYIVDSVKYWADEYHIDGFRFDLVGLIDTQTINEIMEEVHKTHPNVIFYGEGWAMDTTVTKSNVTLTTQTNANLVPGFAFFSDGFRDMLKGSVFDNAATGYVSGASGLSSSAASLWKGFTSWSTNPSQTIQYSNCHDNMTLFDRIVNSTGSAALSDQIRMNNLAAAMTLTSQGVPFLHAGEEMLRSKPIGDGTFSHNSYNLSDAVNSLKWNTLSDEAYQQVYQYYKGLIAFRKAHPALRLDSAAEVKSTIFAMEAPDNVTAFRVSGLAESDPADELILVFNPNPDTVSITLPDGSWNVYINGEKAGTTVLDTVSGTVEVASISALVLAKESSSGNPSQNPSGGSTDSDTPTTPWGLIAGIIGGAAVLGGVIAAVSILKKRSQK